MADGDIADAFYTMELPLPLRRYFALGPIEARWLSISDIGRVPVGPRTLVWPRMAALPMGWSHALAIC